MRAHAQQRKLLLSLLDAIVSRQVTVNHLSALQTTHVNHHAPQLNQEEITMMDAIVNRTLTADQEYALVDNVTVHAQVPLPTHSDVTVHSQLSAVQGTAQ